jgi:hypothetical protein
MLLLDQTLFSLEKQWVLAQATQVGMCPNTSGTWKWGINVPTYRGTGNPLDRSTLKGAGDMVQAVECCFTSIKSRVQAQYSQSKEKKKLGAEEVAQWENVCTACTKPSVQFPSITK